MYIVLLEWYDAELDNLEQESRQYFFDEAETALRFANMVVFKQKYWKEYGCPKSVYLYKAPYLNSMPYPDECFSEENRFIASWFDCDKYLKD